MGCLASVEGGEQKWFLDNLVVTLDLIGIYDEEGLKTRLGMVFWTEGFCKEGIGGIWRSVEGLRDVSLRGMGLGNDWCGVNKVFDFEYGN